MSIKKIILVRHGETAWTLTGQHTGFTDIPLTENGKKQAVGLQHLLSAYPFDHALVSPLKRAKDTFDCLKLSIPFSLDDNLKEWNYGQYEGLTSKQIQEKDPSWNLFTHGAPGGESLQDMTIRARRVIDKALSLPGDVALFSSGHILRSIAAIWLEKDIEIGSHLMLLPASISILSYEHGIPAILLWNKI